MKIKHQKTKAGYTFVELIISMVILFLAVMVIGSIFPASFKSLLKSKQVTIATTLAQQKLEQCLINPKDYKTRVGKEGNFSPDHPEYGYSILEKQVTDKLKEIKVEVYKLSNKGIIDAATAQLVQSGGDIIKKDKRTTAIPLPFSNYNWNDYICSVKITALTSGVYIIDASGSFQNMSRDWAGQMETAIAYIGGTSTGNCVFISEKFINPYAGKGEGAGQEATGLSMTTAIHLNAGTYTFRWLGRYWQGGVLIRTEPSCEMIVHFVPDDSLSEQYKETFNGI